VIKSVGNFSAAQGTAPFVDPKLRAQFVAAFPPEVMKKVHWYPAIPPGLEEIEGRVLDRIKAAD
jgi:spermidine/putrescine transport system substrate-binding protein